MKKKIVSIAVLAAMVFSLVGCSKKVENTVFSVDDLPGKVIGVQLGTTGDIYASDVEDATIERFNKGNDAVSALKAGKVDCVIIDEQPAKAFVEKNSDLMILEEPFENEEYAVCVAKENSDLTAKINTALDELKADGTLDSIISNFIGEERGQHPYVSPEGIDRSNGTIIMATNAAFEPYEFIDNGEIVGIDPSMMQAVADKLGMDLQIEDMEFDAIITAVQSGKATVGAAGMTVTEERLKNIDFTNPYTNAKQVIIVRK